MRGGNHPKPAAEETSPKALMADIHVDSPEDPRLVEYGNLAESELIRASGAFIAEGRLVVQRVIGDGRYRVRSVLVNAAAREALRAPLARLANTVPVYVCVTERFHEVTGFNIHRGCLALVD